MSEIFEPYTRILIWTGLSLVLFLFSLAALPWLVVRIPETYFRDLASGGKKKTTNGGSRAGRLAARGLKNGLGLVLVSAGIVMLFIPGQGILTILAGLILSEFPGKKKLMIFLVGRQEVQNGLNWIREKKGAPLLVFPRQRKG